MMQLVWLTICTLAGIYPDRLISLRTQHMVMEIDKIFRMRFVFSRSCLVAEIGRNPLKFDRSNSLAAIFGSHPFSRQIPSTLSNDILVDR